MSDPTFPEDFSFRLFSLRDSLWLLSDDYSALVRFDPETLETSRLCLLEAPPVHELLHSVIPRFVFRGPLLSTKDWLWLPGSQRSVWRIHPLTGQPERVEVPFDAVEWASDDTYLYATAWPEGLVYRLDQTGEVDSAEVGQHVESMAVGSSVLWVVDRADETLIACNKQTLEVIQRVPMNGGTVESLYAYDDDAVVVHRSESGSVAEVEHFAIGDPLTIHRITPTGENHNLFTVNRLFASTEFRDGTVWFSSEHAWSGFELPEATVREPVRTRRLPIAAQAEDIAFLGAQVWVSGFSISQQHYTMALFPPGSTSPTVVALDGIDWGEPQEREDESPPFREPEPQSSAVIRAELPDALRTAIESPQSVMDDRTGAVIPDWYDWQRPMQVLDILIVEDQVNLTFQWKDDPTKFGWKFDLHSDTVDDICDDITLELMENLDTGVMDSGKRERIDDVTWLSPNRRHRGWHWLLNRLGVD